MTIIMQDFGASIPTWALGALFNHDYTGLTEQDIEQVRSWEKKMLDDCGATSAFYEVSDSTEYFTNHPEFGKPTTCLTIHVTPVKEIINQ